MLRGLLPEVGTGNSVMTPAVGLGPRRYSEKQRRENRGESSDGLHRSLLLRVSPLRGLYLGKRKNRGQTGQAEEAALTVRSAKEGRGPNDAAPPNPLRRKSSGDLEAWVLGLVVCGGGVEESGAGVELDRQGAIGRR